MLSAVFSCVDDCMKGEKSFSIEGSSVRLDTFVLIIQSSDAFIETIGDETFAFLPYLVSQDIEKPQIHFDHIVGNDSAGFFPSLNVKHNSKKELSVDGYNVPTNMFLMEDYARQIGVDIQNNELHGYLNPYAFEINRNVLY